MGLRPAAPVRDARACLEVPAFATTAESEPMPPRCCIPAAPSPSARNELGDPNGLEMGTVWPCGAGGCVGMWGNVWEVLAWLPACFGMLLEELISVPVESKALLNQAGEPVQGKQLGFGGKLPLSRLLLCRSNQAPQLSKEGRGTVLGEIS